MQLHQSTINAELTTVGGPQRCAQFGKLIDMHQAAVLKLLSMMHMTPVTMDQCFDSFVPRFSEEGSNQGTTEEGLMHNSPHCWRNVKMD